MPGLREVTRENYTAELATQRGRDRDPMQLSIDAKTADAVARWEAAGQPTDGSEFANFETDDAAEGKRRVRRAFTQVNGERKEALVKTAVEGLEGDAAKTAAKAAASLYTDLAPMWYKDSEPDAEGWIVIQYGIRHVVSGEKPETDNGDETPAETPADAPSETPETPAETPETPETPAEDAPSGRGFRGRR